MSIHMYQRSLARRSSSTMAQLSARLLARTVFLLVVAQPVVRLECITEKALPLQARIASRLAGIGARPFKWRPPPGRRQGGTRSLGGEVAEGAAVPGWVPEQATRIITGSVRVAGPRLDRGPEIRQSPLGRGPGGSRAQPGDLDSHGTMKEGPRPTEPTQGSVSE